MDESESLLSWCNQEGFENKDKKNRIRFKASC